jgi:glycine dehydrogenase subunit 1
VTGTEDLLALIDQSVSCVIVQTPDFFGNLRDLRTLAETCRRAGALLVAVFTEAVAFGLVTPPGDMGADIVVGEGQSIGNALSFGGPYVGLFASRAQHVRQMPGRICGESLDADGRRGFVLTLSTREQHIRREKATSNICTNSGLCALAFTIHMTLLGESGLRRLARVNHANAVKLADMIARTPGAAVLNQTFFNEFTIAIAGDAAQAIERMAEAGVLGGVPVSRLLPNAGLDELIIVANTEVNTDEDREAFVAALRASLN